MIRILTLALLAVVPLAQAAPPPHKLIVKKAGTERLAKLVPGVGTLVEVVGMINAMGMVKEKEKKVRRIGGALSAKVVVMKASASLSTSAEHSAYLWGRVTAATTFQATAEFSVDLEGMKGNRIGFDKERRILYLVVGDAKPGPVETKHTGTEYEHHTGYWLGGGDDARAMAEGRAKDSFTREDAVKALLLKQNEARYAAEKQVKELVEKFLGVCGVKDVRVEVIVDRED